MRIILNSIYKNICLEDAILSPRIHLEGGELYFEPGIDISKNDISDHIMLHPFEEKNLFFGGVNAVSKDEAIGDKRRGGYGVVS